MNLPPSLIIILGPTAVGKTKVATELAFKVNGEIISADSRQVYRGMDIGTGKDLSDYVIKNQAIPYHLIDICNPGEKYNIHRFQDDFASAFDNITSRSKQAILCGGTGLYIQSILENYSLTTIPQDTNLRKALSGLSKDELLPRLGKYTFPAAFTPDRSTKKRLIRSIEIGEFLKSKAIQPRKALPFNPVIFGLTLEREVRRQHITERLKNRLESGLIEEVETLLRKGIKPDALRYYSLEYKYVTDRLEGLITGKQLFEKLSVAIHQYAKRQMTWFRKMEREGYNIQWIDAQLPLQRKVQTIVDKLTKSK